MSEPITVKYALEAAREIERTSGHTPGPWRAAEARCMTQRTPLDPSDMHYPIFWPDSGCCAHVFRASDARLIAAAPDLLFALQQIMQSLPRNLDWLDPDVEKIAKAAIERATK